MPVGTMARQGRRKMAAEMPEWRFSQCFGEKDADEEFSEADVLSAVEFDETGQFLATGDKGGRIVVFERSESKTSGRGSGRGGGRRRNTCEYRFFTEFQSHEAEFDYLKSLEIEEKINQIRWCKSSNSALFLLSTNDKTIKLWKVFEKKLKVVSSMNLPRGRYGAPPVVSQLKIPTLTFRDTAVCATPRRVYANAHAYHVNSISPCSDGETFLSADDLRINLWNMNNSQISFNIVDIKPENMEELTEVITAASFHPKLCNLFIYSSSRGAIKLADMRSAALCDSHSKVFEVVEDPKSKTFFSEIIASISDCKFTAEGNHIVARDYLTVKIWDIRMESEPVVVIPTHEHLRRKLCDLYENDCIFDKFECCTSGDGKFVMTGSYSNCFNIYDREGKHETCIEVSRIRPRASSTRTFGKGRGRKDASPTTDLSSIDFNRKVLHFAWHPKNYCVAVAGLNNLYIYNA